MEIIKIHYKVSKPVVSFKEIKAEAEALKQFVVYGKYQGFYNKAFAIAHCQVSETPMSFFVVAVDCVRPDDKKDQMFEDMVIINPEILEAPLHKRLYNDNPKATDKIVTVPNAIEYQEMCMSFPFRKPKRIIRYDVIKVRYQIPGLFDGLFGLKTITRELHGIASEIFQHEYDHTQGKNIYFESETPVKWWELLGKDKSIGGTSIDRAEDLGLSASKEKPTDANMAQG